MTKETLAGELDKAILLALEATEGMEKGFDVPIPHARAGDLARIEKVGSA